MSEKFHSNQEDAAETPEMQIENAQNLDDLSRVLERLTGIPTEEGGNEWGLVDANDVLNDLDRLRDGVVNINAIPTGYGLREQVKNLYVTESLAKVETKEDLDATLTQIETAMDGEPLISQSGAEISFEELRGLADNCVIRGAALETITRSYGLRAAVERARNDWTKHFSPLNS